jgi:hypothetical protein
MPTVFYEDGFRFFFYSNEGSPREPVHIHVEKDNAEAKFWLNRVVHVAYNNGLRHSHIAPVGGNRRGKQGQNRKGME